MHEKSLIERLGFTLSPKFVLVFFTACNLLNYIDRGVVVAAQSGYQKEYNLDDAQTGVIASVFMAGFMSSSPFFPVLANMPKVGPNKSMALGLTAWAGACVLAGVSNSYSMLAFARAITGLGEASFAGLAPSCIDDIATPHDRTSWLAIFFSAIPVGLAIGYMAASGISESNWRVPFLIEGLMMIPFILLIVSMPDTKVFASETTAIRDSENKNSLSDSLLSKEEKEESSAVSSYPDYQSSSTPEITTPTKSEQPVPILTAMKGLFFNPIYMTTALGYACFTAVVGALAVWAPKYIATYLDMDKEKANLAFGAIGLVTGISGTFMGGWVLDKYLGGSNGVKGTSRALLFSAIVTCFAFPIGLACFFTSDVSGFFALLFMADFLMFLSMSPINAALLSSVPHELRSFSMAFSILLIHALGDFPSPIITGALSDHYGGNLQRALRLFFLVLLGAIAFWFVAWIWNGIRAKRSPSLSLNVDSQRDEEESTPVLHSKSLSGKEA